MPPMTESRSLLAPIAAAIWFVTALAGHAAAEEDDTVGQPRAVLSTVSVSFSDASSVEVTIANRGGETLTVAGVRVIEEGFGKRKEYVDQIAKAAPARPVFSAVGVPSQLEPGQAATFTINFEWPPNSRQRQFLGSLQLLTNDPRLPVLRLGDGADAARYYVANVKLSAGGSWIYRNVLVLMTFIPLLGMFIIMFLPPGQPGLYRWAALFTSALLLALAYYVWANFDPAIGLKDGNWGLQFVAHTVWIQSFNIEFFMGIDGISVLMVLLTAFVSFIACISSWTITKHVRGYMMMFLLLEAGMMGTFVALDFFLFYVFWELMLLPMYFLIGIWGGPRKEYAAIKFFLYTLAGSVLMLLALIALYYASGDPGVAQEGGQALALVNGVPADNTFDMMKMAHLSDYAGAAAILGVKFTHIVWIALFLGFAIKVPMFPFHTWLPDAHVEAPTAISVILAGILLKMGTYGMFRVNFAVLPDATQWAALAVAVFGVINILYGAFCAFAQTDLKKLVAYSSVSHMGFCLLGMAALTSQGLAGAMMQMFNHGTITSMLFLLVGVLYDRAHTREIDAFGGVAAKMPLYAGFFGFAFMASLGLPGLSGFIGEALVFLGAFNEFRLLVIVAVTAVVVTAAYHLWAMQRILLGKFNDKWSDALRYDMDLRERIMLAPLGAVVLILGFYPMPALDLISVGLADLRAVVLGG
jgi:NADH-quinone oxidoreductase subunit M